MLYLDFYISFTVMLQV